MKGRNVPLSKAKDRFPHGATEILRNARSRLPGDQHIPRDIFNWIFDGFDDRTDGFALPPRRELHGFTPPQYVKFLGPRLEALKASGGTDERLTHQAAYAKRPEGFEDAGSLMQGLLVPPPPSPR